MPERCANMNQLPTFYQKWSRARYVMPRFVFIKTTTRRIWKLQTSASLSCNIKVNFDWKCLILVLERKSMAAWCLAACDCWYKGEMSLILEQMQDYYCENTFLLSTFLTFEIYLTHYKNVMLVMKQSQFNTEAKETLSEKTEYFI